MTKTELEAMRELVKKLRKEKHAEDKARIGSPDKRPTEKDTEEK